MHYLGSVKPGTSALKAVYPIQLHEVKQLEMECPTRVVQKTNFSRWNTSQQISPNGQFRPKIANFDDFFPISKHVLPRLLYTVGISDFFRPNKIKKDFFKLIFFVPILY